MRFRMNLNTHPAAASSYTCYGCHEHQVAGITAKHTRKGIRDFTNCVACHRSAKERSGHGGKAGEGHSDDDD
ncbi:MAG TPA: hypothetical protein VL133_05590 [Devosia sp.]|nr:hypothetical protein [Devosia sp.]